MSQVQVFFDGACHLCSKEINHYKSLDKKSKIDYVDISDVMFCAAKYGLESANFKKYMHVKSSQGHMVTGVGAFLEIWRVLDIWTPMQWAAENRWVRPAMNIGYRLFAEMRPYLPKKEKCEEACKI